MNGETSVPFHPQLGFRKDTDLCENLEVSTEGGRAGWAHFLLLLFSLVEKHVRTHWRCPQDFQTV